MTCKDCIHYDVCDEQKKINYKLSKFVCKRFKDKSCFVELPCKLNTIFYYLNEEDEIKRCKATCISIFNNIEEPCIKVVCIDDDIFREVVIKDVCNGIRSISWNGGVWCRTN